MQQLHMKVYHDMAERKPAEKDVTDCGLRQWGLPLIEHSDLTSEAVQDASVGDHDALRVT